jgi:hypothetical protein
MDAIALIPFPVFSLDPNLVVAFMVRYMYKQRPAAIWRFVKNLCSRVGYRSAIDVAVDHMHQHGWCRGVFIQPVINGPNRVVPCFLIVEHVVIAPCCGCLCLLKVVVQKPCLLRSDGPAQ